MKKNIIGENQFLGACLKICMRYLFEIMTPSDGKMFTFFFLKSRGKPITITVCLWENDHRSPMFYYRIMLLITFHIRIFLHKNVFFLFTPVTWFTVFNVFKYTYPQNKEKTDSVFSRLRCFSTNYYCKICKKSSKGHKVFFNCFGFFPF